MVSCSQRIQEFARTGFIRNTRRDLERLDVPVFDVKGHDEIINAIDGCGIYFPESDNATN